MPSDPNDSASAVRTLTRVLVYLVLGAIAIGLAVVFLPKIGTTVFESSAGTSSDD